MPHSARRPSKPSVPSTLCLGFCKRKRAFSRSSRAGSPCALQRLRRSLHKAFGHNDDSKSSDSVFPSPAKTMKTAHDSCYTINAFYEGSEHAEPARPAARPSMSHDLPSKRSSAVSVLPPLRSQKSSHRSSHKSTPRLLRKRKPPVDSTTEQRFHVSLRLAVDRPQQLDEYFQAPLHMAEDPSVGEPWYDSELYIEPRHQPRRQVSLQAITKDRLPARHSSLASTTVEQLDTDTQAQNVDDFLSHRVSHCKERLAAVERYLDGLRSSSPPAIDRSTTSLPPTTKPRQTRSTASLSNISIDNIPRSQGPRLLDVSRSRWSASTATPPFLVDFGPGSAEASPRSPTFSPASLDSSVVSHSSHTSLSTSAPVHGKIPQIVIDGYFHPFAPTYGTHGSWPLPSLINKSAATIRTCPSTGMLESCTNTNRAKFPDVEPGFFWDRRWQHPNVGTFAFP